MRVSDTFEKCNITFDFEDFCPLSHNLDNTPNGQRFSTMTKVSTYRVGNDWAVTLDFGTEERPAEQRKDPIAIHYVIDNSGSMGSMTKQVQDIFSEMVDSVATAPCSLTVFHNTGK